MSRKIQYVYVDEKYLLKKKEQLREAVKRLDQYLKHTSAFTKIKKKKRTPASE